MIFLDANVFLRVLTSSDDPRVQQSSVRAQGLLLRVERDEVAATTSDAVLAEVAFILTSPRHYRLSVADAAAMLATIVRSVDSRCGKNRRSCEALTCGRRIPELGLSTRSQLRMRRIQTCLSQRLMPISIDSQASSPGHSTNPSSYAGLAGHVAALSHNP